MNDIGYKHWTTADGHEIAVFGDHDQRTIDQLERCVRVEDGARGVLCADGHLGYSQPIGGAVAYRDHVSPSGVGYDIGCLAEGSRVLTADGYHVAIEDLTLRDRVMKSDETGFVSPAVDYAGVTHRGERDVVELELRDRAVRLTPDHEVRTRDRAKDLATR